MLEGPYRLAALAVSGTLLSGAGLVCCNFHSVFSSLPLLTTCLASAVIGTLGMYWASYVLGEGVRTERWPEETLAPFRRVIGHALWKMVTVVIIVAMLATLTQDRHHRTWFLFVFFVLQAQMQINSAFARPGKALDFGTRPDWSQSLPLHSEHWGER